MNEPTSYQPNEIDIQLERFDKRWHKGEVPAIDDFLPPKEVLDDTNRHELLTELVNLDLEYRWRQRCDGDRDTAGAGSTKNPALSGTLPNRPVLEDYVRCYPLLGPLQALPVRLIVDEYRIRHRWGDRPAAAEYLRRFGEQAGELRIRLQPIEQQLPLPMAMVQVRCPECHHAVELSDNDPLSRVSCRSCGSSFSLASDDTVAQQTSQLRNISHFELLELLGTGSFGTVWRARDTELDRTVAIKIPRKDQLDAAETEQFLREARAVGQLTHPNIVRVHEVGRQDDTLYIVTEYIDGVTLADRIAGRPMTPREAARLCEKIAAALHHAHEAGVIHRDLKPANVMLAFGPRHASVEPAAGTAQHSQNIDDDGGPTEPFIMDFGLARRDAGEVTMTVDGKVLGTPAYMSPEQADGRAHQVDRRSDVYSLGVMLFEMVTGERPFRGSVSVVLHHVMHDDAPSPRRFNRQVPRDIETICLRCLEKDPRQRYATAQAVADDLRRYLADEPIRARPVSNLERGYKWCHRNPIVATLTSALTISLLAGLLGVTSQWLAVKAEVESKRRLLYVSDMGKAAEAWESASVGVTLDRLERHFPGPGEDDLRGFEWYHLWKRCQPSLLAKTLHKEFSVFAMDISQSGRYLAAAGGPGTTIVYDLGTGKVLHRPTRDHPIVAVQGLAFSPNASLLAASGGDGQTYLWNVTTGERVKILNFGSYGVAFSADSKRLAVCGESGESEDSVTVWDVSSPSQPQKLHALSASDVGNAVGCVAFSPTDRSVIACGGDDQRIRLWSLASGLQIGAPLEGHTASVMTLDFSPDGKTLVSGGSDKTVRFWDVDTRTQRAILEGHTSNVWSVAFSPDGKRVVSASFDGTAKLWDVAQPRLLDTIRGHEFMVSSAVFSPDNDCIYTGSGDGVIKRWDLADREQKAPFTGYKMALSADGSTLATAVLRQPSNYEIVLCNVKDRSKIGESQKFRRIRDIKFSPEGEILVVATQAGVKICDVPTLRVRHELEQQDAVLAISPDNLLGVGGFDGDVQLCDMKTQQLKRTLQGIGGESRKLVFSPPNGRRLLAACGEKKKYCVILDPDTGEQLAALHGHFGYVNSIAFSPNGEVLATGGFGGKIKFWSTRTWEELDKNIIGRHQHRVSALAFAPDGKTLVSASRDNTIKLWHVDTGGHLLTLRGHEGGVEDLAFSPDAKVLISCSYDGTILFWPAASQEELDEADWPTVTNGRRR